jgi:hypothetical protein
VLALGGYSATELSDVDRTKLLKYLHNAYCDEPHAGIHSAVRWLLRSWGEGEWVADADRKLVGPWSPGRDWYVNQIGMLMILVRGQENAPVPITKNKGRKRG